MAVHTGTCAGYNALLDTLLNVLTGVVGGLGASEQWTVLADIGSGTEREVYLKAPGYVGPGAINIEPYIQIKRGSVPASNAFWLKINAATGFDGGATYEAQPGVSEIETYTPLPESSTISYTMVANGRRFFVCCKAGTSFLPLSGGFYLTGHTPQEIPYPIMVGGCCARNDQPFNATTYGLSAFWDGAGATGAATGHLRHIDGEWLRIGNFISQESGQRPSRLDDSKYVYTHPYYQTGLTFPVGKSAHNAYPLREIVLMTEHAGGQIYGWLDGLYWISGDGNAPENTTTIAGDDYLILPSVYRSGAIQEFAALKLV